MTAEITHEGAIILRAESYAEGHFLFATFGALPDQEIRLERHVVQGPTMGEYGWAELQIATGPKAP